MTVPEATGLRAWRCHAALARSGAYLRVQRDGLAADLVEALHTDDVARNHDEGREQAAFVGVAGDNLQGTPAGLGGGTRGRDRGDAGTHGCGGLEPEAARRSGGTEGHGTGDGGHADVN